MAGKTQDLVVKMTINSKDFEQGLTNAKASVKKFDQDSGLSGLTKKIGLLAAAMKAADIAKDTFVKGLNSTESSADSAASAMRQLNKTYDAVIQSLANGNSGFTLTIDNLTQIAKNAKAAYEALDKLSTFQMWSSADRSIINAQIAEDRVIVNSKTATDDEKEAAQQRINSNTKRLEGLSQQYLSNTQDAQVAVLREIAKATGDVTDEMLAGYVESWKKGTLKQEAMKFWEQNATEQTRSFTMTAGDQQWQQEQTYTQWSSPQAEKQYQAMMSLVNARETDEGWGEYFKLVKEEGQIRTEIANTINKANRASQKTLGAVTHQGAAQEREATDLIPQLSPISAVKDEDFGLETIEQVNRALEEQQRLMQENEAIESIWLKMWQEKIDEVNTYASALNYAGSAFSNLAEIVGDDSPFKKFATMLSSIASNISSLISTYSSLVAVKSVATSIEAGEGIPFPYNLVAIAATASAIAGIIASAKSTFAGSYADGGIVGGNSYSGDKLFARVNSGEMILNRQQQTALFGGQGGNVHFVIEGSQLKGVLDNYNKIEAL